MQAQMSSLSQSEKENMDKAARSIQAAARGRASRVRVTDIRARKKYEEEATKALLRATVADEFDSSSEQHLHNPFVQMSNEVDSVSSRLVKAGSSIGMKFPDSPRGWGDALSERSGASSNRSLSQQETDARMKLKKRLMKMERRAREIESMVARALSGQMAPGGYHSAAGLQQSHRARSTDDGQAIGDGNGKVSLDMAKFAEGGTDSSWPAQADALVRSSAAASGNVLGHGRGGAQGSFSPPPVVDTLSDSDGANAEYEGGVDADEWPMGRDTWSERELGLTPVLPHTEAEGATSNGLSPNPWRRTRNVARYPTDKQLRSRAEKYFLNKESFVKLLSSKVKNVASADGAGEKAQDAADGGTSRSGEAGGWGTGDVAETSVEAQVEEVPSSANGGSMLSDTLRAISWVVKTIRQIYDDKLLAEVAAYRKGFQAPTMPEYLLEWASLRFGMPSLVEQNCWDLYRSVHAYRKYSLEVDMFANFVDEVYSAEQLSFYLFTRSMLFDTIGESVASRLEFRPLQVPLSAAVSVVLRVLGGLPAKGLLNLLYKIDETARPERPMERRLQLDMADLLASSDGVDGKDVGTATGDVHSSETFNRYFRKKKNKSSGEQDEDSTAAENKAHYGALVRFKERLLASCRGERVPTNSGQREVDSQRLLYLCLREFRAAQRQFRRGIRKALREVPPQGGMLNVSEAEFADRLVAVEARWNRQDARRIFEQALKEPRKGSFVTAKQLIKLSSQMYSNMVLLPHARISNPDDKMSGKTLEQRLNIILGTVASHWPTFEPTLNRSGNNFGATLQRQHGVVAPLDMGRMQSSVSPGIVTEPQARAYTDLFGQTGGRKRPQANVTSASPNRLVAGSPLLPVQRRAHGLLPPM